MTKMREKDCPHQQGGCDFGRRFPEIDSDKIPGGVILCSAPRLMWLSCKKSLPAYDEHTQIQRVEFLQVVLKELHYVLKNGDSHDIEDFFSELMADYFEVGESLTLLLDDLK
jgi:hypothetical protein